MASHPRKPGPRRSGSSTRTARAVHAQRLHRHRAQADRRRRQRPVRLAVPPLPRRQAGARRRGDPPVGRDVRRARDERVRRRARHPHRRPRLLRRRGRGAASPPTTPTRARSRRSRSRSRARTNRCVSRPPRCSRAGSPAATTRSRPPASSRRRRASSRSRSSSCSKARSSSAARRARPRRSTSPGDPRPRSSKPPSRADPLTALARRSRRGSDRPESSAVCRRWLKGTARGCSSMAEPQPSKLAMPVRSRSPALENVLVTVRSCPAAQPNKHSEALPFSDSPAAANVRCCSHTIRPTPPASLFRRFGRSIAWSSRAAMAASRSRAACQRGDQHRASAGSTTSPTGFEANLHRDQEDADPVA